MQADTQPADTSGGNIQLSPEQIAYSVPHAAEVLDFSERHMWDLIKSGEVESFKVGASRRITRAALVAFIASKADAA